MSKLHIKNKYGVTPNELLNNSEISLRAKGLFTFLQSKPDSWKFSTERISKQTKEGINSVRKALQELEEKGYLVRTAEKKDGKWNGYNYTLYEKPSYLKPTTEERSSENCEPSSKNNSSKKDIVKKNIKDEESLLQLKKGFDRFRLAYKQDLGGGTRGLDTEFDNAAKKHILTEDLINRMGSGAKRLMHKLQKENPDEPQKYAPMLQTFINQSQWEMYEKE